MYGKLSPSMYSGSMVGAGAMAFALMPYCIANARPDENCTVDLHPQILASIFGESKERVEEAIRYLCSPDPNSRSQVCEGRRLIHVGPGPFRYKVVNLQKYRDDATSEVRREYWRQHKAWTRNCKKGDFVFDPTMSTNSVDNSQIVPDKAVDKGLSTVDVQAADADADADACTPKGNGGGEKAENTEKTGNTQTVTEARVVIHFLNEQTGRHFREVDANISIINARLKEGGVTLDGVKAMIGRQVRRWRGTEQEEFLRPETLFAKSKFDGYYAARDLPISNGKGPTLAQKHEADVINAALRGL